MLLKSMLPLTFALFIWGLSVSISWALIPIPVIGIVLALAISTCINATMGAGLIALLAAMNMLEIKYLYTIPVGGVLPGLNFLPFWVLLVVMCALAKAKEEDGVLGQVATVATAVEKPTLQNMRAAAVATRPQTERAQTGRPPVAQETEEEQNVVPLQQERNRAPMQDIVSRPANDNRPYVQKAA